MINFDLENHKPLREIVYDQLKRQILTGKISPGTRMMEISLADEMGVSRTPVREAIRKLEKEGLVTIEPRRGAYASNISVIDVIDTLEVREELEGFAAALAAERITNAEIDEMVAMTEKYAEAVTANDTEQIIHYDEMFHKAIVKASRNKTLIKISETVQELVLRFRYVYYDDFSRYENMPREHREIIAAIRKGSADEAKKVADTHVRKLKDLVIRQGEEIFKIS